MAPLLLPHEPEALCRRTFNVEPKELQMEIARNIGERRDSILIAGCGWGKTLVYFLPLVFWPEKVIVIISPLRALMEEQHRKLADLGISSICIMEGNIGSDIVQTLTTGDHQAVFMTPEIIFKSTRLKGLWQHSRWKQRLLAVVVDEAHCIVTWGNDFRPEYGDLGKLRPVVPQAAFIALSATLPNRILDIVKDSLQMKANVAIYNVGNDRPNVRLEVRRIKPGSSQFSSLLFILDHNKTIVYFNNRMETVDALDYLEQEAPHYKGRIAYYHSTSCDRTKANNMEAFRDGRILILLSTEAAGMGCDIGDVIRVVQFKHPDNVLTLVQRLGRAARDPKIQGTGVLIVSSQCKSKEQKDRELGQYINTTECRRKVLNEIFGNGHRPNRNCCDLCHPLEQEFVPFSVSTRAREGASSAANFHRKHSIEKERRAKVAIESWRQAAFERDYKPRGPMFRPETVLSDGYIAKLVANMTKITTPESILSIVKWSPPFPSHVQEVGDILVGINDDVDSNEQPIQWIQLNQQEVSRSTDGLIHRNEDPQPPPAPRPRRTFDIFKISTPADMARKANNKRPRVD